MILTADKWKDYQLLDTGDKEKLEIWKDVTLVRPDPQAIWKKTDKKLWDSYDGLYSRSSNGGGSWKFRKALPEYWTVDYRDLTFKVSPTNFKHTGLFPEQAVNWDYISDLIRNSDREVKVLNLFGYTGAATMAASKAGAAEVVHVDAAKGIVNWAKENMSLNHLEDHVIRFFVDDCLKFVQREQRRGHKYDIILMDPPSYGRGPNGEVWKLEDKIEELLSETVKILSDKPLAFIINSYTTGLSSLVMENMVRQIFMPVYPDGKITSYELALPCRNSDVLLPCGYTTHFEVSDD